MLLRDAAQRFLTHRETLGGSERTLLTYCDRLRALADYADAHAVKTLAGVTCPLVVDSLAARTLCPASRRAHVTAIRAFLRYCDERGWRTSCHPEELKFPRVPKKLPSCLDLRQLRALLGVCPATRLGRRDRALFMFLTDTCLRARECLSVRVGDLQFTQDGGRVRVLGKGQVERIVSFGRETQIALRTYLRAWYVTDRDAFVWQSQRGPLAYDGLLEICHRRGTEAGLSGLHPHTLRHTGATLLLKATGNLVAVRDVLGHSTLQQSLHYARLARAEGAEIAAANSVFDRKPQSPLERAKQRLAG